MKIVIITARYSISGVPLAQFRLAQALADRRHEVTLIYGYIDDSTVPPPAAGFHLVLWRFSRVRAMFWALVKYLWRNEPDIVFSAEDHLNVLVLIVAIVTRTRAKISVSSRVTPFDTYSSILLSKRWCLKHLARLVMWRADALTCVSQDMVQQYRQVFPFSRHVCVYNIVNDSRASTRMLEAVDHPWLANKSVPVIVAAGSLVPWKGFTYLIHAVSIVQRYTEVRVLVLGDGPLRSELESQVVNYGLCASIQFLGYVENPLKYFARADLFVLSSLVEGLPNVLVEAMMCGCTPIAADCPTGPREVLCDGKYGYLFPPKDSEALAFSIQKALDSRVSIEVLRCAVESFSEERVIARHFEVLGLCEQPSI